MGNKKLIALIGTHADEINALRQAIKTTYLNKNTDLQAWKQACATFKESYDRLAFPGGLQRGLAALKEQDANAIANAIDYLQANPYCYRSGYVKGDIAHLLKQAPLTENQIKRLQTILIAAVTGKSGTEFREYCRLARKIADQEFSEKFLSLCSQMRPPRANA